MKPAGKDWLLAMRALVLLLLAQEPRTKTETENENFSLPAGMLCFGWTAQGCRDSGTQNQRSDSTFAEQRPAGRM